MEISLNKKYTNIMPQNNNIDNFKISNTNTNKSTLKDNLVSTIQINETNPNIINVKKSFDSFRSACEEFGLVTASTGQKSDMSLLYNDMLILMNYKGIPTANFILDSENDSSFLKSVDAVKNFAENFLQKNPGSFPDSILDFCDLFKNKLMLNNCT